MSNIFDLLQSQLTPNVVQDLSKQLRTDQNTVKAASEGAFSAIVQGLTKNASKGNGANLLMAALDRDHDGNILDDITSFLGQSAAPKSRATNGLGILDHVLGNNVDGIMQMISKGSGMNMLKTANLMQMLAPLVMGALAKQKKIQNLNAGGLAGLLQNTVKEASSQRKELSLIEKLIDSDGDGNIMDDVAGIGANLLKGFFRK